MVGEIKWLIFLTISVQLMNVQSFFFLSPARSLRKTALFNLPMPMQSKGEGIFIAESAAKVQQNERKTFKRFMQIEVWKQPSLEAMFPILCSIEMACRDINRLMRRISTDNLEGLHSSAAGVGSVNIQGEDQKKLDVIANRIMKVSLCCSKKISAVASEEDSVPSLCSAVADNAAFSGDYAAVFDPLDGSSNIDSGLPTGTIFGVYRNPAFGACDPLTTVTQKGTQLRVAGYCLYSAATHLVLTLGQGVHMFTLDDATGEFYLTRSNLRIPESGPIYSFNDAHSAHWEPAIGAFLSNLKINRGETSDCRGRRPTARYMGALVADTHNILMNGGIFGYPAAVTSNSCSTSSSSSSDSVSNTDSHSNGKLRLLYEANPLAMVVEQAGGMASNGRERILDLPVASVHQRTPLFLGSPAQLRSLQFYVSAGEAPAASEF